MKPEELRLLAEKSIEKGLVALLERQVQPGRFTLWPYEQGGYAFLTPYALDYLLSAGEAGYRVPEELLRAARQETLALLQGSARSQDGLRLMAYAAWVYVRSGQRFTGLPRLIKNLDAGLKDWRKEPAAALLAACYRMMRQDAEAEEIIRTVRAIDESGKSRRYGGWFYSRLWENSLLLSAISRHFPERLDSLEGRKALVQVINEVSGGGYSTAGAAQAIRAIADYAAANLGGKPELSIRALASDKSVLPLEAAGEMVRRIAAGHEAAFFNFAGAEGLYWQINADGFDRRPEPPQARKLSARARYIPADGKKLEELSQGDEVFVLITAGASEPSDNVAMTSLIPGGFEMVISKGGRLMGGGAEAAPERRSAPDYAEDDADEDGGDEDEGDYAEESEVEEEVAGWDAESPAARPNAAYMREAREMLSSSGLEGMSGEVMPVVYVERREDRMVIYASLDSRDKVFVYRIKAVNKGLFTLPGLFAEALYDPDARAVSAAGKIEVK
jgi:uncharacterized protein YfaS (alpha-2-macroglobulin family)